VGGGERTRAQPENIRRVDPLEKRLRKPLPFRGLGGNSKGKLQGEKRPEGTTTMKGESTWTKRFPQNLGEKNRALLRREGGKEKGQSTRKAETFNFYLKQPTLSRREGHGGGEKSVERLVNRVGKTGGNQGYPWMRGVGEGQTFVDGNQEEIKRKSQPITNPPAEQGGKSHLLSRQKASWWGPWSKKCTCTKEPLLQN